MFHQEASVETIKLIIFRLMEPYLRRRLPENGEILDGNDRYEGYSMDLISEIAKELKFKFRFELTADGKYGNYDDKIKGWNGLIGDLLSRVCL